MKILVFSDSHGRYRPMQQIIQRQKNTIDAVFFLGDGLNEVNAMEGLFPEVAFRCVIGNCDGQHFLGNPYQFDETLLLDDKRIFLTHGHRWQVKFGMKMLVQKAETDDIDITLFGHTHSPQFFSISPGEDPAMPVTKPRWFCNPGTAQEMFGILEYGNFGISFHSTPFKDIL